MGPADPMHADRGVLSVLSVAGEAPAAGGRHQVIVRGSSYVDLEKLQGWRVGDDGWTGWFEGL